VQLAEDNTLTGPDAGDAGTGVSGPALAGTMTNPGGYQIGYKSVRAEGTGTNEESGTGGAVGERRLPDTDYALFLADCNEVGSFEVDLVTAENT